MLLYTIIEDISKYLLPKAYSFGCIEGGVPFKNSTFTKDFMSLMHVCREWRQSLLPRYYQTARVQLHRHVSYLPWMFNLSEYISGSYLAMVKELAISVDLATLLLPDKHPKNFKNILATLPILPLVNCVIIDINVVYSKVFDFPDNELPDENDIESLIKLNMPILAEHIYKIAPNSNELHWRNMWNFNNSNSKEMHNAASQMVYVFIRPELSRLYFVDSLIEPLLQTPVVPTKLRSLCVQNIGTSDIDFELVIRNSESLEYLRILCTTMKSAKFLIYDSSLPSCTRVYPQLCHLVINSFISQFVADDEQPQSNPFPKLKALMCEGMFPFNAPKIFLDRSPQISHLKLTMDFTLYTMLQSEHILDKGAFTNLYYLSTDLRYTPQYEFEDDEDIITLIKITAELSDSTRVLKFPRYHCSELNGLLLSLEFPVFLQRLTLPPNPLDIDVLVTLFSKLKYLQEATVSFHCFIGCSKTQVPSDEYIQKYQQRFKDINANIHTINANIYGSRFALKTAENAVLLASILSNVLRMKIYSKPQTSGNRLDLVNKAIQRPVYRNNERLQRITFTVSQAEMF